MGQELREILGRRTYIRDLRHDHGFHGRPANTAGYKFDNEGRYYSVTCRSVSQMDGYSSARKVLYENRSHKERSQAGQNEYLQIHPTSRVHRVTDCSFRFGFVFCELVEYLAECSSVCRSSFVSDAC